MTSDASAVRYAAVSLPEFSRLGPEPRIGSSVYEARIRALRQRMAALAVDRVVVYADREHVANISYLTGFDPRFEEALAVIGASGPVTIVAGNESMALVPDNVLEVRGVLCQDLSLPGQDRSIRKSVRAALREAGVAPGHRVGVVGWKALESDDDTTGLFVAIPQFVLAAVEASTELPVVDLTAALCGLDGLRTLNEADQIAFDEHRATRASQHVWRAIEALRPGKTELEVAAAMGLAGVPLSCHVMCTSGTDRVNGLRSPSDRVIAEGDRFSTAVGLWGGLTCRAGWVLHADHPEAADAARTFAGPYWNSVVAWYETIRVGAVAGDVVRAVLDRLAPAGIRPLLNPGHFLDLDEWTNSPFVPGSSLSLRSGMVLQSDIIPVGSSPGFVANVEDGVALADERLRAELRSRYPELWGRVEGRRRFMTEVLGIRLSEDVLPLSDRQAAMPAGLLDPTVVFTRA